MQITRSRVRLNIDRSVNGNLVDMVTGGTPQFSRGDDVQFELGLLISGALADVGNLASIRVQVKPDNSRTALPLMDVTVSSFNASLTLDQWQSNDPAQYHALATFVDGLTNLDLQGATQKQFWLVVSVITTDSPAHDVAVGYGEILVNESGAYNIAPSLVVGPTYYTAAQCDALFSGSLAAGKVAKTGDSMSGLLQFTGTTNAGLRLNNLTTTQRNALSATEGMLVMDTTLLYPLFYNGAGWKGVVTSFNGSAGDVSVTSDGISEGSTNLYFTTARVLATALTGLSITGGAIVATDTILQAMGKIQNQLNGAGGGVLWSSITSTPTTLAGYGITDAVNSATTRTANTILAGPTTGSAAAATFRALVAADIPAIAQSGVTGLVAALAALMPIAGGTFTGAITLAAGTPSGLNPTSRTFTDATYLPLAGGTMTGALNTLDVTVNSANAISWSTAPTNAGHLVNKTYSDLKLALAGGTLTGNLLFSGTTIGGLVLNNLTDTQRAALVTPAIGTVIWNSTLATTQVYNGASWINMGAGAGTVWFSGSDLTPPSNSLGTDGNYYLGTIRGNVYLNTGGVWAQILAGGIPSTGGVLTGNLSFSGTGFTGMILNNLTTTQRNALGNTGGIIFNATSGSIDFYDGSVWYSLGGSASGFLPTTGGTMTGLLNLTGASPSVSGLRLGSYTTTQRNGLTGVAGDTLFNSTTNLLNVYNGSGWLALGAELPLAGGTLTGDLLFSGTGHAGLQLNSLTTTQRNAVGANGNLVYNSTLGSIDAFVGGVWASLLTSANAFPVQVNYTQDTGKSAIESATTLFTTSSAGIYRVSCYLECTAGGSGTLQVNALWVDQRGSATKQLCAVSVASASNQGDGSAIFYSVTSAAIQYQTTGTVTGTWSIYFITERLA